MTGPSQIADRSQQRGDQMSTAEIGAASGAPNRGVVIRAWRVHKKNTLEGFLTVALPSGMILHDLTLHQRDEKQWIGMPAREWENNQGEKQYSRIIKYVDRAAADRFQVAVLEALTQYLETHHDTCA